MEDLTIRDSADAREAYIGLRTLLRIRSLLNEAKREVECADTDCSFLDGFPAEAPEIDAAAADIALEYRIARFREALGQWEERGTSEPGRVLVSEVI